MQIIWHSLGNHWDGITNSRRFKSWCNGCLICIGDILGSCGLKILLLQYYYYGHYCNRYILDNSNYPSLFVSLVILIKSNYSAKSVTAQIALYFIQEQGESVEFIGINEHFHTRLLDKIEGKLSSYNQMSIPKHSKAYVAEQGINEDMIC